MFDTIHRILPIRARSRQCMREHNCHRLSILFLRNERIATSGLQNIKIRFLLDYYLWQFFRELRRMDTLRNDARYSSSTRFYRPKLFLHLDLSFRECEGYAWILYPDCVSCNVYFINWPELDVAELFYTRERSNNSTLSYEIRPRFLRRIYETSGYKNFVEISPDCESRFEFHSNVDGTKASTANVTRE